MCVYLSKHNRVDIYWSVTMSGYSLSIRSLDTCTENRSNNYTWYRTLLTNEEKYVQLNRCITSNITTHTYRLRVIRTITSKIAHCKQITLHTPFVHVLLFKSFKYKVCRSIRRVTANLLCASLFSKAVITYRLHPYICVV